MPLCLAIVMLVCLAAFNIYDVRLSDLPLLLSPMCFPRQIRWCGLLAATAEGITTSLRQF